MPVMAVYEDQHEQAGDYWSRPRWWAGKKTEGVPRLFRGEASKRSRRGARMEAHQLVAWREASREGGKKALTGQRPDGLGDDRGVLWAERKIGQLSMENEILRVAAEQHGASRSP